MGLANELSAMAEWLCHGGEQSESLAFTTRSIDTFRGPATVRRWIQSLTTFEVHSGDDGCPFDVYLDFPAPTISLAATAEGP